MKVFLLHRQMDGRSNESSWRGRGLTEGAWPTFRRTTGGTCRTARGIQQVTFCVCTCMNGLAKHFVRSSAVDVRYRDVPSLFRSLTSKNFLHPARHFPFPIIQRGPLISGADPNVPLPPPSSANERSLLVNRHKYVAQNNRRRSQLAVFTGRDVTAAAAGAGGGGGERGRTEKR